MQIQSQSIWNKNKIFVEGVMVIGFPFLSLFLKITGVRLEKACNCYCALFHCQQNCFNKNRSIKSYGLQYSIQRMTFKNKNLKMIIIAIIVTHFYHLDCIIKYY